MSDELTFEQAQGELEQIVSRLERGDVAVDEAIDLWRRGEQLYRLCLGKLETAEGLVEELTAQDADKNG